MARMARVLCGVLSITAMLLFSGYGTAEAAKAHTFTCNDCHKSTLLPRSVDNFCVGCHSSGSIDAAAKAAGTFSVADASNAMGSHPSPPVPGESTGTSHYWGGSKTAMLPAGSQNPAAAFYSSRYGTSTNVVTCTICHEPHADMATQPKLLRAVVTEDLICKQCHQSYYVDNASARMTHPVGAAVVLTADPLKFNAAPTAPVQLVNGYVSCTSCHATHFADSDASTPQAKGQVLTGGDGNLLRTNGTLVTGGSPQETADLQSSACTACHPYKTHGVNEPIGCLACHGAHVYSTTPNIYVLRNNMSTTTFGPVTGAAYTTTGTPATRWADGTPGTTNGFCEKCHGDLQSIAGRAHTEGEDCTQCHVHNKVGAVRSFEGSGCDGCHGSPPSVNVEGGPNGYAAGYTPFKDESATPHASHAGAASGYNFACSFCHNADFASNHQKGTFQNVLDGATFQAAVVPAGSGLTPSYTASGVGTCNSVACHSNGGKRTGDAAYTYTTTAPTWTGTKGSISTCDACHGNSVATMTSKNNSTSHIDHLNAGVTCNICHATTADSNTALHAGAAGTTHVNGAKNLSFSGLATGATYNATTGVCSNVACHGSATPDWDIAASGDCGTCHGNPPATGAHTIHTAGVAMTARVCTDCHANDGPGGTGHADGNISMVSASYQADVCNPCHGAQNGNSTAGNPDRQPVWTNATSVDCQTCHAGSVVATIDSKVAANKNVASTSGHSKTTGTYSVSGNPAANQSCDACHVTTPAGHLDATAGDTRLIGGFTCDSCHGAAGTATKKNINTHQSSNCTVCHDPHGSTNIYMVNTGSAAFSGTVAFTATTGANSYDEVDAANGDDICATCHTAGNQTQQHNNKTNTGVAHNEGLDCFNCHKAHTDATPFAAGAGDSCAACHSAEPTSGAHASHIIVAGIYDTEDRSDCESCHTGAASYTYDPTTDRTNGLNHGDATGRLTKLSASVGYNGSTCASACHNGASGQTATWSDTSLGCNACHYQSATPTSVANSADANPLTGTHNQHFDATALCTDCHGAVTDTTHITDNSGATNVLVITGKAEALQNEATVTAAALGATGTDPDPGNATCNNIACHNPSNGAFSATWAVTVATCNTCHSDTNPGTNGHSSHLAASVPTTFGKTVACTDCHTDNGADNAHRDGSVGFTGAVTYDAVTNFTCNATVCHTDGLGTPVETPQWTRAASAADDCTACHGNAPATGRHAIHLANTTFVTACTNCHTAQTAATHIDGTVDNTVTYVPATGSCTNNCHTVTAATYGDWKDAAKLNCTDCHSSTKSLDKGWPPATGAHAVHIANTSYVTGANCTDCHNNNSVTHSAINNVVTAAIGTKLTVNPGNGSCTNSCHLAAQASDWTGGSAAITCTDCHTAGTYVGGGANLPTSGLHTVTPTITGQKHDQSVAGGCAACHNTLTAKTTHIDGALTGDTMANLGLQYYTQTAANTGTCLTACHTTNSADWAHKWMATANYSNATASCTGCHGDLAQTWNSGVVHRAVTAQHNIGTTYQCKDCHGLEATANTYIFAFGSNDWSGTSKHGNGSIEINNNTATYNETTGICATCHTATGADGVHNFQDTGWTIAALPADPIIAGCGSCHTGGKSTTGSSGAHDAHGSSLADEATCTPCHGDNGGAGYGVYTGTHKDGSVNFAGVTYSTATRNDVTGTCSTSACHDKANKQSAAWNAANLACDDCHYYAAGTTPTSAGNGTATQSLSADHGNHFGTGGTFACATCHGTDPVYNTHMTELTGTTLAQKATPVQDNATVTVTTWVDGTNTCSNTACHNPSGTSYSAVWQTSTASCTLCHSATDPGTLSHDEHMTAATTFGINTIACTSCHGTLPVSNSHLNSTVNFAAGMGYTAGAETVGGSVGTCTTTTCHNNGTAAATAVPSPTWGQASANCSICHVATPTSGEHTSHLANTNYVTTSCNSCHTAETATTHINGVRNFGAPISAYTSADGTCTNSCHTVVNGRDWTAGAALNCDDCHNAGATKSLYVAAGSSNWPVNSNKHAAHTGSNSLPQTGANDCFACHNNTVNSSGVITGTGHLNLTKGDLSFNSTYNYETIAVTKAGSGTTTTCSNVLCHNGVTTPTWAAASTISCGKCHNTSGTGPLPSGSIAGSHAAHANNDGDFADCASCHVNVNSYSASGGHADHQNLTINIVPNGGTYTDADGSAGVNYSGDGVDDGTCANSCHGVAASPAWGNAGSVTCTSCHNNGTNDGVIANAVPTATATIHTTHNTANNAYVASDCDACHGAGSSTAAYSSNAAHINGTLADGAATYANKLSTYTSADGTCANSCHNVTNGRDWTSATALNCDDCHAAVGKDLYRNRTSGSHSSHYSSTPTLYGSSTNNSSGTTYNFGCGQCHPTAGVNHLNASTGGEIQVGINYSGGAAGTCSQNSCHQDGQSGAPATIPTWGTAFVGDSCNKCHGNSPTSDAHEVHAVGIHATDIYTGTSGLLADGATAPTGHGDGNSTTINCNICHNNTVTTPRNPLGSECLSCHGAETNYMTVSNTANHLNGSVNVVFASTTVKSKAQLRDNLADAALDTVWTRTNGYKAATSYDVSPTTLAATAGYAAGSCSAVACHNGNAATWAPPTNNCLSCHTSLPK